MTDQQQPEQDIDPTATPESAALVETAMAEVTKGKITLADLFYRVNKPVATGTQDKTPPLTQRLSEEAKLAIKRLPEVFGKTLVLKDRALTLPEQQALIEERQTITLIMDALKKRKDEVIREYLANHADHVLEADLSEEEREAMRRDAKGHYAPWETQNIPVDGTDFKIQRFASGGKPNLTIQDVEAMHAEGLLDRKTYLAVTKKPDLPRVLNEAGLHKAIQKNPRLFFLFASRAKAAPPTTTVKVEKNT